MKEHAMQAITGARVRAPLRIGRRALLAGLITLGCVWPCLATAADPPDPLEITIDVLGPDELELQNGIVNRIPLPPDSDKGEGAKSDPDGSNDRGQQYSRPGDRSPNEDYTWRPPPEEEHPPPPPLLPPLPVGG